MSSVFYFGLLAIFLCGAIDAAKCKQCQENSGWEKVSGMKPELVKLKVALFSTVNSESLVKPCFERCERYNCTAFVIDFEKSICYSVELESDDFVPEPNTTFYHKICIKVPEACKRGRLWQIERTLGAILIDTNSISLPQPMTRSKCYERCMEAGNNCKSAQFRTSKALSINDTIGRCSLSMIERGTRPQSYRASMYRDEYLQNQCHKLRKQDYCSYAEFRNVTLSYADLVLPGLDIKDCEEKCDQSEDGFICKAYTVDYTAVNKPTCRLHSEDSTSLGVSSLIDTPNFVVHKEREPCLDLKVQCSDSTLIVELRSAEPFVGRMYASGYGDVCGVQGTRRNVTILTLPLPKKEDVGKTNLACGLTPAYSINNENRTHTLVWVTIVIQYNPIIQRLGDQAVRVGCSLNGRDIPKPRNITVQSSFTFFDPNAGVPPIVSTVTNMSEVPVVTMRILDEDTKDTVLAHLGVKLMLKIEMKPVDGPYDIMAGHLIASSETGESSLLLLDEVGCPTDPTNFPALLKDPADNRSLLSTFAAFKFPNSQVVRFNAIVKFCLEECMPAKCRSNQISYGKKRRRSIASTTPIVTATAGIYVTEVTEISKNTIPDELPLQLSIIVQRPVIYADTLLSTRRENATPDTVLIAAGGNSTLCVDAGLALGLFIFWLIIQIVLIIGCLFAIGRYRKMAIQAEEDRADILTRHLYGIHSGNFEIARRVRWADHNSSIG